MKNTDLLESRGWKVRNKATLHCFKKKFLIELIDTLENNWSNEIEKNKNLISIIVEGSENDKK